MTTTYSDFTPDYLIALLSASILSTTVILIRYLSQRYNGAAIATVLVYSSAAFRALLGWWTLQESLDRAKILAISFSLGACILVSGMLEAATWQVNLLGLLTGLQSGLWYAIYSLMGRWAGQRDLNPWTTLFNNFGFATAFLLVFNLRPVAHFPGKAAGPEDLFWLGTAMAGDSID
jgi:drug/metabolite transporter (DMT)-like permease